MCITVDNLQTYSLRSRSKITKDKVGRWLKKSARTNEKKKCKYQDESFQNIVDLVQPDPCFLT